MLTAQDLLVAMKLLEDDAPTHSQNLLDKSMGLDAHQVQESLDF